MHNMQLKAKNLHFFISTVASYRYLVSKNEQ